MTQMHIKKLADINKKLTFTTAKAKSRVNKN